MTKIYGGSDDLIEIGGDIEDEVGCYDHKKPIAISASDGTAATIFYDGEWKINVKFAGDKYAEVVSSVGEDGKHIGNAVGCTSYSDVLIFNDGIEWVKIKGKTYKKLKPMSDKIRKEVVEMIAPMIKKARTSKKVTITITNERGKSFGVGKKEMEVKELASAIGTSSAHVYMMESGKSIPSLTLLFEIAKAVGKKVKISFV